MNTPLGGYMNGGIEAPRAPPGFRHVTGNTAEMLRQQSFGRDEPPAQNFDSMIFNGVTRGGRQATVARAATE